MESLNQSLYLLFNASAQPSTFLLQLATFLAQWLIDGIPLLLVWLWLRGGPIERYAAVTATLGVLFALGCGQVISTLWPHPRPFMISLGHTFLEHTPDASFPSDHATVFFTLGVGLILSSLRKLGAVVLLLGVLVSWSRVYLGVHFPFDIAGALLLAIPCAWLVRRALHCRQVGARLLDALEWLYRRIYPADARRSSRALIESEIH